MKIFVTTITRYRRDIGDQHHVVGAYSSEDRAVGAGCAALTRAGGNCAWRVSECEIDERVSDGIFAQQVNETQTDLDKKPTRTKTVAAGIFLVGLALTLLFALIFFSPVAWP